MRCPSILEGLLLAAVSLIAGSLLAVGDDSVTLPEGYCKIGAYGGSGTYLGLQANSDTLVSLPFTRAPQYSGTVQSISGNVVTVAGTPAWTASQFVYSSSQTNTYYALLGPGNGVTNPKEGCFYTVTTNTANTLTLDLNGDAITAVPANTQITLIPYWTLSTLFPNQNATVSYTPTTSTRTLETEVLIPNYSSAGINLAYAQAYYYINSGANVGWRLFGSSTTVNHGDDPLATDGYVVVRNQNGAPTLPLIVTGTVPTWKWSVPLTSEQTTSQDNALGLPRPVGVTLNDTGLNPADGSFRATTSTRSLQDELLIYDNSQVSFNKSASTAYYYLNSGVNVGWRLFGDAISTDHGGDVIPAGSAFTIRRVSTSNDATVFWTNTPFY